MDNIGTHNSATGEQPSDIITCLGALIGKCQSKTISQQCKAGVRLFDLRVKPYRHATRYNLYYPLENIRSCTLGHGLCDYATSLQEAVTTINDYGKAHGIEMYVLVTLEGRLGHSSQMDDPDDNDLREAFRKDVQRFIRDYSNVTLLEVNIKYPEWMQLYRNPASKVTYTKDYPLIKGWKALLPFPKFWNRFIEYGEEKENVYSLRDFV